LSLKSNVLKRLDDVIYILFYLFVTDRVVLSLAYNFKLSIMQYNDKVINEENFIFIILQFEKIIVSKRV